MTYNIRHGRGADQRVDLGRIAAVIAAGEPDIVALQEVDVGHRRSGAVDQPAELGRRLGMQARFAPCITDGEFQYGIATLSRLPLLASRDLSLPIHPGLGRSEPRRMLATRIAWAGGAIELLNTHLSLRAVERLDQVAILIEDVAAIGGDLIVAGDLNFTPRNAAYRALRALLDDAGPPGSSWPARLPVLRLDHLLYRGGLRLERSTFLRDRLARRASDHLPLVAAFYKGDLPPPCPAS
jgi:endonuclease/exonuclease/phosphatase family metal-dependent hydrolase